MTPESGLQTPQIQLPPTPLNLGGETFSSNGWNGAVSPRVEYLSMAEEQGVDSKSSYTYPPYGLEEGQ